MAGAALALCTLQNIRKMSNLHKNDTNSLEETCIQLSAPALAQLRSQRLAGGWLQGTQPRATHFISGCLTSKLQTASAQLATVLARSLPPCHAIPLPLPLPLPLLHHLDVQAAGQGWQCLAEAGWDLVLLLPSPVGKGLCD